MINNRQNGRRGRGRNGVRPQGGGGPRTDQGNRIDNRSRGNASQLHEKYKTLARDAQMQGDRVMTEYYLQFADHYFRVLSEGQRRFEEQRPRGAEGYGQPYQDEEFDEAGGEEGFDDPRAPQPQPQMQPRRDENRGQDARRDEPRSERRYAQDRPERAERGDRPERSERPERAPRYAEERRYEERRPDARVEDAREEQPARSTPAVEAAAVEPAAEAPRPRRGRPPRVAPSEPASGGNGHAGEPGEQFDMTALPPSIALAIPAPGEAAGGEEAPRRRRVRRPRPETDGGEPSGDVAA